MIKAPLLYLKSFFTHLIIEINIQRRYLFHLRGKYRRGDGGQVLRGSSVKESGEVIRASAPEALG